MKKLKVSGKSSKRKGPKAVAGEAEAPAPDASKDRRADLARNVLASLIGVVLTVGVGDLLVKRNYDGAISEFKVVDQAVVTAADDFDGLVDKVNDLVKDRRAAVQRLSEYAAANSVAKFVAYYDGAYVPAVNAWNEEAPALLQRIRNMTSCREQVPGAGLATQIDAKIYAPRAGANAGFGDAAQAFVASKVAGDSKTRYCPETFLFQSRDESAVADPYASAFEVFKGMHALLLDSRKRDLVSCTEAAESIREAALKRCDYTSLTVLGRSFHVSAALCLKVTSVAYGQQRLCPVAAYGKLASFNPPWWDSLDHRWHLGIEMLKLYRSSYIQSKCDEAAGSWTHLLRRDACDLGS